jgi:dolichol-phosphate mannosyltransferase
LAAAWGDAHVERGGISAMMKQGNPLVSVVVPAMNESECLSKLHEELRKVCDALPYRFEFVFVDDGSTDNSAEVLARLRREDRRVRYLLLSRNFGHQAALSAGLAHASGQAVIMMDGDLQHPPSLIPELLARWSEGYDVVNTIRVETEAIHGIKRLFSDSFYKAFNWLSNVQIQQGAADFRLVSRAVADSLKDLPERHRFLRGLVPWLGFKQTYVRFTAPARFAGRTKYSFLRNIRFALDGFTSFSFYPLRRMTVAGWLITLASAVYGLWAIASHIAGKTVPGWTSLIICVVFFGGCQLIAFGVIGEYVGRILEQVKGRPIFIVREAVGIGDEEAATVPFQAPNGRAAVEPALVEHELGG